MWRGDPLPHHLQVIVYDYGDGLCGSLLCCRLLDLYYEGTVFDLA